MSISINIGNILNSPTNTFNIIIDKLQKKNINLAKEELLLKIELDETLIDAILLTLELLKEEEGFISQLIYSYFGIGKEKNKRREQLIILGSQLKSELNKSLKSLQKTKHYNENLYSSTKNLTRLHKAFKDKIPFLDSYNLQNRAISYMREINIVLESISLYQDELDIRANHLKRIVNKYRRVLRQIPRYHEIQEDTYIQMIGTKKTEKKESIQEDCHYAS